MRWKIIFILGLALLSSFVLAVDVSNFNNADVMIAAHAPDNDTSLVLYMPFERNYIDESPEQKNNGTVYGNTILNISGAIGQSAQFDGNDDYLTVTSNADISFGARNKTVSAWVKPVSLPSSGGEMMIFYKGDPGVSGDYVLSLYNNAGTQSVIGGNVIVPYTTSTTEWTHLVASFNSTHAFVYANGQQIGSGAFTSVANNNALGIGARHTAANDFYGKIDEARIYNRTLTATEIFTHYALGRNNHTVTAEGYAPSVSLNSSDSVGLSFDVAWYKNGTLNRSTGNVNDNSLNAWLPLDNDVKDYKGSNDGTAFGNAHLNRTYSIMGGGSYDFDGTGDYINLSRNTELDSMIDGNHTISMWVKSSSTTSPMRIWGMADAGTGTHAVLFNYPSTGYLKYYEGSGVDAEALTSATSNINNGKWRFVVFRIGGTNQSIFVDGVYDTSRTKVAGTSSDNNFGIGWDGVTNSQMFNGQIDEVKIYNRSLTATEIKIMYDAALWAGLTVPRAATSNNENWTIQITPVNSSAIGTSFNDSICIGSCVSEASAPTVSNTWASPANDGNRTRFNITFDWGECTGGTAPYSYHFLLGTTNPPTTEVYYGNWTNWTTEFTSEDTYFYQQYCNDSGGFYSGNSTTRNLTVDWSSPTDTILYEPSAKSGKANEYLNVTLEDNTELYAYNITIYNRSNMQQIYSVQNVTLTGTKVNITFNWSQSGWNIGTNITWHLNYSDKSTAIAIADYPTTTTSDKFVFDTGNDEVSIQIENMPAITTKLTTEKLVDRKTFSFYDKTLPSRYNFSILVTSKEEVRYTPDFEPYHLIYGTGIGKGWVSLKNKDKGAIYTDGGKTKTGYRVWVYTNDLNFQSIGGLNFGSDSGEYTYDTRLNGHCTQFLNIDSYTGTTINYNLTVECFNPNTAQFDGVTVDVDDDFNTSTSTFAIPAASKVSASFYNVSQRGTSDGGLITLSGASITGDIVETTNPIKYYVPIDPPYAFTKDGVVDCGTSAVNTNIIIPYPLTFIGNGQFPINALLSVTGFEIGNGCITVISNTGRMVIG